MRQKRNLKYHQDFKFRVSLQLQRGGLTCRNLWSFSTLFVKLSTKSGEVHLCYYLRYLIIRSGSARTLQIQRTTKMLQTTIFASLFAVSLATVATSQVLSIDIDGDGAPDQLTAHSVNGGMTLSLCRSVGLPLSIQALPPASINDVRVLPPTDLDGDGLLDLVISIPTYQTGRVWIFSGAATTTGTIQASNATYCLQSSMPGAMQFGDALGLLPGESFGAPACLRVRSLPATQNGELFPRVEVFRLDTQRVLLVAEGTGALTDVWSDRGDGTRDGKVDAADIPKSLARVGTAASFDGDLDGDGVVTVGDVALLVSDATIASANANDDWESVVQSMLIRTGGIAEWGMPMVLVASGSAQQPQPPAPSGTGVFYCARPFSVYESWPWWLSPVCHAYLQIGDWTRGFGGDSPTESPNDGRSRKCWEATRRPTGTMTVGDQRINCADATIEQIQQCVQDLANSGGVCQEYGTVCNNCGDWVMDIIGACCLDGSFLPYLIY